MERVALTAIPLKSEPKQGNLDFLLKKIITAAGA